MIFLTNSFSLGMLTELDANIKVTEITLDDAKDLLAKGFTSAVGHQSTADIFTDALCVPVQMNRTALKMNQGDILLVGQYIGPRLEEGAKVLPEGAVIKWVKIVVTYND